MVKFVARCRDHYTPWDKPGDDELGNATCDSSLTHFYGVNFAIAHLAARRFDKAIEWAERALRLSPFDPWNWFPCHGLALGHFSLGHYQEASAAARKAIQLNPGFSMSHMLLAASLVRAGQL